MGQAIAAKFFTGQATSASNGGAVDAGSPNNPETTWWCRMLGRVLGTLAGIVALLSGIFSLVTLDPFCIVAGLLLFCAAIVVLVFEAPICCTFIELTKPIAVFAEHRTFFQKAIIYVALSIIPFFMCLGLRTLFGCGLIFATGVFYGIMGLGRKADRERMMTAASSTERPRDLSKPDDTRVGLIENEDSYRNNQSPFMSGQSFPK